LPFNAPKKYWDLYDRSSIPIASDPFIPQNVHPKSVGKMGEFYNYKLSDEKPTLDQAVSDDYARKLIHGYYASISYIDHLIGQLLAELKSLDLDKNTMIVLWGDHGWHLGNDRKWGKHSLFERSLKSALIVKLPGRQNKLRQINAIVESVDLYPTLLDYCGISPPYDMDGKSLLGLIQSGKSNKINQAFGFWKDGISIRTDSYRLTKFYREEEPKIELYDHLVDPEENRNIAADHPKLVDSLVLVLEEKLPEFYSKIR
jgi:arylsulfatase A-like enzyme